MPRPNGSRRTARRYDEYSAADGAKQVGFLPEAVEVLGRALLKLGRMSASRRLDSRTQGVAGGNDTWVGGWYRLAGARRFLGVHDKERRETNDAQDAEHNRSSEHAGQPCSPAGQGGRAIMIGE